MTLALISEKPSIALKGGEVHTEVVFAAPTTLYPSLPSVDNYIPYINEEETNYSIPLPRGSYTVSSHYGWRWGREHQGIDLSAPTGTPVLASKAGVVVLSQWYGAYGYTVIIEHSDGERTLYAHLSATGTNVGTTIPQGRVIGWVGSTGRSTGPHLHFEIRTGQGPIDPRLALTF